MSSSNEGQTQGLDPSARHQEGAGLLFFDLDDTIVQGGSHISVRVVRALEAAKNAGYVLAVATGRPLCLVRPAVLRHGLMTYAVCANGATLHRLSDGAVIASHLLSTEDALACCDLLRPYDPSWNAFFDGQAFFEWRGASYMLTGRAGAAARAARNTGGRPGPFVRAAKLVRRGARFVWRNLSNPRQHQVRSLRRHLMRAQGGIQKMGCTIPDEDRCARAALDLAADGRFEVVRMGATELEITAAGVTKASGAQALMRALGMGPERAVAFGDGGNDLPLSQAVGCFVAMGNADPEVKAAADAVCPAVTEDGVAVWIEDMLAQAGLSR